MTRYKVRATLTYIVDLLDEEAVYEHAEDLDVLDVERPEVYVEDITEIEK